MERSAFGVVHKADRMSDALSSILPGTTVRAHDYSTRNKKRAATSNFAAKVGGATLGGAVGLGLAALARRRIAPLREGVKISSAGKTLEVTPDELKGWTRSGLSGALGGFGGSVAGTYSLKRIQKNPKYRYRQKG